MPSRHLLGTRPGPASALISPRVRVDGSAQCMVRLCTLRAVFRRGLYTGLLGAGGFVHCGPRLEGTLHTGIGRNCTNPRRNRPHSAQSPGHQTRYE